MNVYRLWCSDCQSYIRYPATLTRDTVEAGHAEHRRLHSIANPQQDRGSGAQGTPSGEPIETNDHATAAKEADAMTDPTIERMRALAASGMTADAGAAEWVADTLEAAQGPEALSLYMAASATRRSIIVAPSAREAGQIALQAGLIEGSDTTATVGRLGVYDPGMEGARLSPTSIIGTWEIEQPSIAEQIDAIAHPDSEWARTRRTGAR